MVCYPITVTNSTPRTNFFLKNRELLVFLLVVSVIGLFYTFSAESKPRVTISGLYLGLKPAQVEDVLGKADFETTVSGAYRMVYYSEEERPRLQVTFNDAKGGCYRIEGGTPEIDGKSYLRWKTTELPLGLAQNGGTSGTVGENGQRLFLTYPQHNLLVQNEDGKMNRFILFCSPDEV